MTYGDFADIFSYKFFVGAINSFGLIMTSWLVVGIIVRLRFPVFPEKELATLDL